MPGLPRLDLAATEGKGAGWGGRATVRHLRVILSLSVCLYGARVRMCTGVRRISSDNGPFFKNFLHNHFITEKKFKKKSGDVNDEANFSFFILLHKRAKPILPPYLLPHLHAR